MKFLSSLLLTLKQAITGRHESRVRATPRVLDGAFQPGYKTATPDLIAVRVIEAGHLKITSGRIVATDPFVNPDAGAFDFKVSPGEYPVRLAVADFGQNHFRVALARLDFRDTPAVRWEMALLPGQSLRNLKPGQIYGYGVDAGTGAFADAAALTALEQARQADGYNSDQWIDEWISAGEAGGVTRGLPHVFLLNLDVSPNKNIVMFSSGWGDGFYASWVGYDAKGAVTALVTDFAVLDTVP